MALSDIRRLSDKMIRNSYMYMYMRENGRVYLRLQKKNIIIMVLTTFQRFKSDFRKKQKTLLGKEIQTIFLRHE